MKKIRHALDDSPRNPRFIETVPRQGYRFIAAVGEAGEDVPPAHSGVMAVTVGAKRGWFVS